MSAEEQALLREAGRTLREGDARRACSLYLAFARQPSAIRDHALHLAAECARRLNRPRDRQRLHRQIVEEHPDSLHVPAALLHLGREELSRGRLDRARTLLYRALAESSARVEGVRTGGASGWFAEADLATRDESWLALAEAEESRGDLEEALRHWNSLRAAAPGSARAREAGRRVRKVRERHPEWQPSGRAQLEEAGWLLAEGEPEEASREAERLRDNPAGADPDRVLRLYAESRLAVEDLDAGLKTLWQVAERYRWSPQGPEALLRLAQWLWNHDRDPAALRAFEEFQRRYPRHSKVPEALYGMARIEQQGGRPDQAIERYGDLARRFPDHALAAEARWRIGWIHFRNRRWQPAAEAFVRARTVGTMASYWEARAREQAGDRRTAHRLYREVLTKEPHGYYALQAQRRLDGAGGIPFRLSHRSTPDPTPVPRPLLPDPLTPSVARWADLHAVGETALACRELRAAEAKGSPSPEFRRFLVEAYAASDGWAAAARLLRTPSDLILSPEQRQEIASPLAFWSSVRRLADAQGVDPFLVLAVMRQESAFDPEARSTAGATGLLQILPGTAEEVASILYPRPDVTRLTDPEVNLSVGIAHLKALLDRHGGDPLRALAAYNAGPSALARWMARHGGEEPDIFVESITWRETREYVKRVISHHGEYLHRYGTRP